MSDDTSEVVTDSVQLVSGKAVQPRRLLRNVELHDNSDQCSVHAREAEAALARQVVEGVVDFDSRRISFRPAIPRRIFEPSDILARVERPTVPVTIVTGFLGSGKSTLLQEWLGQMPPNETAVIVNERGDVGIDGELLAARVARLREITGGCVCCSSQAELMAALMELSEATPAPRRIFVETSGAATPAGVIRGIAAPRIRERLVLDGVVTVVDVTRLVTTLRFDLAVEQLGFADVVVLSHFDEVSPAPDGPADELRAAVCRHAPLAVLAESRGGVVSQSFLELLSLRNESVHVPPSGTGHSVIEAVSLIFDGELDEDRFADWVESALGDVEARILRIKGILAMRGVDSRVILQGVSESVKVELGRAWGDDPRASRLVVLGLGLDAPALEVGFLECALQPTT